MRVALGEPDAVAATIIPIAIVLMANPWGGGTRPLRLGKLSNFACWDDETAH